jgi:uncharacterized membrane protein
VRLFSLRALAPLGLATATGHAPAIAERLRRAWDWVASFERAPEPLPTSPSVRRGLLAAIAAALVYTAFMTAYCFGLQDTFRTHAEELGIMDQALWNTLHGRFMQESICNSVWNINCLGDVPRFAIHFEPILIPLSLLYLIVPSVKWLLFIQAAGVASGAIPAYLLAVRRLRYASWGLIFAALYLLYPPLLSAVVHDFHPETPAAGLLLWALYFLVTRRDRALIVACVVLLMCKETLTLDVMAIGVFAALIQRRPRLGLALVTLAALTLALALGLMHALSPIGQSPVAGRYDDLLKHPLSAIAHAVTDPARLSYLVKLLGPVAFLPLLSPWTAFMAAPAIALNFFSAFPGMYSGSNQYNTDIAAMLIFAAIDALVWVAPAVGRLARRVRLAVSASSAASASPQAPRGVARWLRPQIAVLALVVLALPLGLQGPVGHAAHYLDAWPTPTPHTRLGDRLLALVPPDASVSAQATLVPHLSHRAHIHQFPSGAFVDEYIVLDTTVTDSYPFYSNRAFLRAVQLIEDQPDVSVVASQDGYLILHRTDPGD